EGQFYRIGGYTPVNVDVRIIAATHQDLEKRVKEGLFREDLFHRLNVIRVQLPPLRERIEDIPRLADYFLQNTAKELGVEAKVLHPDSEKILQRYYWSGNVRQLENVCRWLTVMAASQEILPQDLPDDLLEEHPQQNAVIKSSQTDAVPTQSLSSHNPSSAAQWFELLEEWTDNALIEGKEDLFAQTIPLLERTMLKCALKYTNGHKQEAARLLGWGRNTLTRKLKELGIE
ncbi:sigma 54-interacting transcriptional regulator, partial [Providencia rettgeri]|nr:sigma 54-interacting transcriptional regulator [Providencia rettgeri]